MADFQAAASKKKVKIPPISKRHYPNPFLVIFNSIAIVVLFLILFVSLHPVQYLAIPLYWIHRPSFRWIQNYIKETWVTYLTLITQLFGPSTLVITSDIADEEFVTFAGDQPYTHFPHKFVAIANHQVGIHGK